MRKLIAAGAVATGLALLTTSSAQAGPASSAHAGSASHLAQVTGPALSGHPGSASRPAQGSAHPGPASRPAQGTAHGGPAARVSGTGDFVFTFSPDDDVRRFTFDVRADPYTRPLPGAERGLPTDAKGTVRVYHWVAASKIAVTFEATADCLVTAPGAATVTAVVTRADEQVKDWVGKRVGFSVADGGRGGPDRAGLSWVVSGDQDDNGTWGPAKIGTCLAPTAFAPVTRGGFTVRHQDLLPPE